MRHHEAPASALTLALGCAPLQDDGTFDKFVEVFLQVTRGGGPVTGKPSPSQKGGERGQGGRQGREGAERSASRDLETSV
jgi:hypothetical protein